MTNPTPKELAQLLAGIEQANAEIISAIKARYTSQYAVNGKHGDDRVKAAIRAHSMAVAMVWQPPANGISAAKPMRNDLGFEAAP